MSDYDVPRATTARAIHRVGELARVVREQVDRLDDLNRPRPYRVRGHRHTLGAITAIEGVPTERVEDIDRDTLVVLDADGNPSDQGEQASRMGTWDGTPMPDPATRTRGSLRPGTAAAPEPRDAQRGSVGRRRDERAEPTVEAPSLLSDPAEPHTYVRGDARPTERRAATLALPRSGTDRARILAMLVAAGDRGLTTDEASARMVTEEGRPDRPNQYASRVKELVESGWVEDSRTVRLTRTGADATVWRVTVAGRAAWRGRER